jgi:CheY-like chemotaxis protein
MKCVLMFSDHIEFALVSEQLAAPARWRPAEFTRPEPRGSPDVTMAVACDDLLVGPTVVIVDDHAGFRSWARALLEAEGFDVVGEAGDGISALSALGRLRPQVVLVDISLPGMDGFEVAERLARAGTGPAVVLVSTRGVSAYRRRLARSPARGLIAKSELTSAS